MQVWNTHGHRTHRDGGLTFGAFTDTEHSQEWTISRHRAFMGKEYSQICSTHRHGALMDAEHSQIWSTHRCRALTGKEHLWPQSVEHTDHVCGTLPHVVHQEPFVNNTTPRVSSTPLHGNCVLQLSIVPMTSQSRRLHVVHTQEGDFLKVLNCGGHLANIKWIST